MPQKSKMQGAMQRQRAKPGSALKTGAAAETPEIKWARKQLEAVSSQLQTAVAQGETWVKEPHTWHQSKLERLIEKLETGKLNVIPSDVQEGVEFYISQYSQGEATPRSFYNDDEIYKVLSKGVMDTSLAPVEAPYERPACRSEDLEASGKLRDWVDITPYGISKLGSLMRCHSDSPDVQEIGLKRLSYLVMQNNKAKSQAPGLAPKLLVPLVRDALSRCPQDCQLQRQGCVTLRALTLGQGGLTAVLDAGGASMVVDVLKAHMANEEVALITTRLIEEMTAKSSANSPERAYVSATGVIAYLPQVSLLHVNNPYIEKAAKTTIPFLRE